MKSDLLDLLWAAAVGEELPVVDWHAGAAVSVVMASRGYPGSSSRGDVIRGLGDAAALPEVEVFHAATGWAGGDLVTSGGRVLTVTGRGDSFTEARARAYAGVAAIRFEGAQYRSDIALRAEQRERGG
jgi:phosphoribosylamine--glycine ligase